MALILVARYDTARGNNEVALWTRTAVSRSSGSMWVQIMRSSSNSVRTIVARVSTLITREQISTSSWVSSPTRAFQCWWSEPQPMAIAGKIIRGPYSKIFPELAAQHGELLYTEFKEGVTGHPELLQMDHDHPDAAGEAIVVKNMLPMVEALLAQVHHTEEQQRIGTRLFAPCMLALASSQPRQAFGVLDIANILAVDWSPACGPREWRYG